MTSEVDRLNSLIRKVCFVQIAFNLYAYYIYRAANEDPKYRSLFDVNETFQCSGIHTTNYIKGFGAVAAYFLGDSSILNQPHQIYGILLYVPLIAFSFNNSPPWAKLTLLLSTWAALYSTAILCILVFILNQMCLLGLLVAAGNYMLAGLGWHKMRNIDRMGKSDGKEKLICSGKEKN